MGIIMHTGLDSLLLKAAGFVPDRMVFPNAWCGHLPFAFWLIDTLKPANFVELGTHTGNSYLTFCQAVKQVGSDTRCFAVDTWEGDEHAGYYGGEVYANLSDYHQPRYAQFSTLLRSTFDDALNNFEERSIHLLHIDGLHTYEAVRHDFESWLPKLAPGALVLFHDIAVRERGFAVWQLWEELCARYSHHLVFDHSNGLGVLQIEGESSQEEWMKPNSVAQIKVQRYFTALGNTMLERYRAVELLELAKFQQTEIDKHRQFEEKLQLNLTELSQQLADARLDIHSLQQELGVSLSQVAALRTSTSWKVTAPLRVIGLLRRGETALLRTKLLNWLKNKTKPFHSDKIFNQMLRWLERRLDPSGSFLIDSDANQAALAAIVHERYKITKALPEIDPLRPRVPEIWPTIDISAVTFNSERWIEEFVSSLLALDYPLSHLTICFVDNGSTDSTWEKLTEASTRLRAQGISVSCDQRPNRGFGAGHNIAVAMGTAEYCLVSNVDLVFEREALKRVVAIAVGDEQRVVAWELRQKPYEHPKFHDPVTGITNWNSHACILLRRASFEQVGGYDERLFMYGEDVELSYRFRMAGYLLRYCPSAVVWHYSTPDPTQIKPLQYTGSTFANLYLRLKYGTAKDKRQVPLMALRLLAAPEPYKGAHRDVWKKLVRLAWLAPRVFQRNREEVQFPFRAWDYEMARDGAAFKHKGMPEQMPLVSVITRTYAGRELFLKQAMYSVAHQTWENIEHIIVEDGASSMQTLVENVAAVTGCATRYIANGKKGRSSAGNTGLAVARGRWCLFLDDDDLLFADHVETLALALMDRPDAVASYALAWEVVTDASCLEPGNYKEIDYRLPIVFKQEFDPAILMKHNYFTIQSVLFERTLAMERGGFEEDLEVLEDWVLWNKYALENQFVYVPKVTSLYRTPADALIIQQRHAAFGEGYPVALVRINRQSKGHRDLHL